MSEASAPVVRTLSVPLFVSSDDRESLHATIDAFNFAVAYAVEHAPSPAPTDDELRAAVYEDLLGETNLPRRLVLRAYAEAGDYLRRRAERDATRVDGGEADAAADGTTDSVDDDFTTPTDDPETRSDAGVIDPDDVDLPQFDHPSVAYDAESFTPGTDGVTLQTVDGSVTAEYDLSNIQRAYLSENQFTVTDGVLHYVEETATFYIQLNLRRRPSLT